jgi:hypothetical protein
VANSQVPRFEARRLTTEKVTHICQFWIYEKNASGITVPKHVIFQKCTNKASSNIPNIT